MRDEIGGIDALVIIRGGGSLESFQAFNNETLVRAIVDFPVPVIAGIGHDQDVPLAALAADFMTSTPTAAAHLLNRSWEEAFAKVLPARFDFRSRSTGDKATRRTISMQRGVSLITTDRTPHRLGEGTDRLCRRFIRLNDPQRQLKLGYSITRQNGKIVRSISGLCKAMSEDELGDGTVRSRVSKRN